MPVYATEQQLAEWLGLSEPPSGATRALRDASLDVDTLLIGAIYAVDEQGAPTAPDVALALQEATCAQAEYNPKGHTGTIDDGQKVSVKVDKVSVTRATDPTSGRVIRDLYSQKAVTILRLAGLVPAPPVVP